MKRYYIKNFPGPLAGSENSRGFLAELSEINLTTGTPYERLQREWTRNLYHSAFLPISMVNNIKLPTTWKLTLEIRVIDEGTV